MKIPLSCLISLLPLSLPAQTDTIKITLSERHQVIDGFGAHQGNDHVLSLSDGTASLSVPAYGIVTLYGPGAVPVAVGAASDRPTIQLFQNQPNPAGSSTRIGFSLPQPEYVQLHLYDAQGRLLKTLVEEIKAPGVHGITLPLTALAAGTYFYKIKAGSFEATRKMVVVK